MRRPAALARFLIFCWTISYTLISLLLTVTHLMGLGPFTLGASEYLLLQLMCVVIAAWVTFLRRQRGMAPVAFWGLSYAGCIGTVLGIGLASGWFLPREIWGPVITASCVYLVTGASVWVREARQEKRINERLASLRGRGGEDQ